MCEYCRNKNHKYLDAKTGYECYDKIESYVDAEGDPTIDIVTTVDAFGPLSQKQHSWIFIKFCPMCGRRLTDGLVIYNQDGTHRVTLT